jgi:hypothetical protein
MSPSRHRVAHALLGLGLASAGWCDESRFTATAAIDESRLAEVRGGFELPTQLHASLSVERAAFVDGERVVNLRADIPDIAHMTAGQATALQSVIAPLVIQDGPGNTVLANLAPAATVIQNTLNDQRLLSLTTINVDVNTLGAFRDLGFHDALRDHLVPGVR